MDISPQTIRQVEFREKKIGGYHPDDVDEFLERMAAGVEIIQERLRLATDRAVRAEAAATESREDDESLRKTLVLAQRTADLAVKEGREQAARLLESAEEEAATLRRDAQEEARSLIEQAQAQVRADVTRLEATRRQLDDDVDRLYRYLDEQRARAKGVLNDAAAHIDRALTLPERPVLSDISEEYEDEQEPVADAGELDRELLAEVVDRGREEPEYPTRSRWHRS